MHKLGEARVVQRAGNLVEHGAQVRRTLPVFVADPDYRIEPLYVAVVLETARGHLTGQAGLAVAAQPDDQHDGRALLESVDHLTEGLRAHHELAVGRRRQIVVDARRARARRTDRAEPVKQLVGEWVAGGVEEALQPLATQVAAIDRRRGQDLDGAFLWRQVAGLVALDGLAREVEQLSQLLFNDRRGPALVGRDAVDRAAQ